MSDEVVHVPPLLPSGNVHNNNASPKQAHPAPTKPLTNSDNLMDQFNLTEILTELRNRKLRSSFMFLINEIPTDVVPLKPRCPAGSLLQVAMQPVNEDERRLELFDERVIRNALTLKETHEPVKMPEWLSVEQPWGESDRRKKRRDKKKKKKKKKRKRDAEEADTIDGTLREDERRARKKRK
ncbi:unnamed protein product [Agarophyton chilense]|eukprot:gb/GEZJ01003994.1/.p1 GENE.gb/GEZJ01003994.1/~~gb/GEZJ01003994.1/.p1  ORF type:complete len:182 (+),score=33.96 gb/GEZJ01003994.1/:327-872(+)